MLQLVPPGLNIDFLGKAKVCITISAVVILIGLASIVLHGGLNEGIDFSGGTLLQLRFSQPAVLGEVREALGEIGLGKSIVQHFGDQHEVLIRTDNLQGRDKISDNRSRKRCKTVFQVKQLSSAALK